MLKRAEIPPTPIVHLREIRTIGPRYGKKSIGAKDGGGKEKEGFALAGGGGVPSSHVVLRPLLDW